MIKQGTLVLVKETPDTSLADKGVLDENGALWVRITDPTDPTDIAYIDPSFTIHWYKSLATGEPYVWHNYEVAVAGGGSPND